MVKNKKSFHSIQRRRLMARNKNKINGRRHLQFIQDNQDTQENLSS